MPLSAFTAIFQWVKDYHAIHKYNFNSKPRSYKVVMQDLHTKMNMQTDGFTPKVITWLPDKVPATIYVRSFTSA